MNISQLDNMYKSFFETDFSNLIYEYNLDKGITLIPSDEDSFSLNSSIKGTLFIEAERPIDNIGLIVRYCIDYETVNKLFNLNTGLFLLSNIVNNMFISAAKHGPIKSVQFCIFKSPTSTETNVVFFRELSDNQGLELRLYIRW